MEQWQDSNSMFNVISCQETLRHDGNVCDLENGIDDWCTFLRIETYINDGISAFGGTVTDGGDAWRTGIVMSHEIWIFSWNGSCDVCCGNGFSGSGMILSDYCYYCGSGCGYGSDQSPNNPEK